MLYRAFSYIQYIDKQTHLVSTIKYKYKRLFMTSITPTCLSTICRESTNKMYHKPNSPLHVLIALSVIFETLKR